jgi:hypothetical protein
MALLGIKLATGVGRKRIVELLLIALVFLGLGLPVACSSSRSVGGSLGTPAGTYTITVTGTSSSGTQVGTPPTVTLNVQ